MYAQTSLKKSVRIHKNTHAVMNVIAPDVRPCDTANLIPSASRNLFACQGEQIWIMRRGVKTPIVWADLKREFQEGGMAPEDLKAVGDLRKNTINTMLREEVNSACYDAAGSTDLTSDLDFTYMTFQKPNNVMQTLLNFYAKFYRQFGNFSDVVFDTNFYVTNTVMTIPCYDSITDAKVKDLFIPLPTKTGMTVMGAWFPESEVAWQALDEDMAYLGIEENMQNIMHHRGAGAKLPDMLRFGYALFAILDAIQAIMVPPESASKKCAFLLLLRLLVCLGSVNSNEKYVSGSTMAFIVLGIPLKTSRARFLAYLDNLVYLEEWRLVAGQRTDDSAFLTFFDASSKYMGRLQDSLAGEEEGFAPAEFHRLCTLAKKWREKVRGKIALEHAKTHEDGKAVLGELALMGCDSVAGIMRVLDAVTSKVRAKFSHPTDLAKQLYTDVKRVITSSVDVQTTPQYLMSVGVKDSTAFISQLRGICDQATHALAHAYGSRLQLQQPLGGGGSRASYFGMKTRASP